MTPTVISRSQWTPPRILAALLLLGTALYMLPSALHGDPPINSAPATLEYVAQRPSWRLMHMLNILAVFVWAGTFTAIMSLAAPTSRHLTNATRIALAAGTATFAVYFGIHAIGLSSAADQYFAQNANQGAVVERTEALLLILGSTAFTAQAMVGLAVTMVGITLSRSTALPGWVGLCGALTGAGWLAGALMMSFAVIVPFLTLTWVWTVVLAVVLWRKSGRLATAPA